MKYLLRLIAFLLLGISMIMFIEEVIDQAIYVSIIAGFFLSLSSYIKEDNDNRF